MAMMIVKGIVELVGRKPHLSGVAVKVRDEKSGILFDVIVDEDDGVIEGEKVSASGEVVWLDTLHLSHLVCNRLARKGDQKIAHRKPRFVDQSPVPARSPRQRSEAVVPSRERQDSSVERAGASRSNEEGRTSSRKPAGKKSRSTRPKPSGGRDVKPDIENLDVSAFQFKRRATEDGVAKADDVPKASVKRGESEKAQVHVNEFEMDDSDSGEEVNSSPPPMSDDEAAQIMQRMDNDNW